MISGIKKGANIFKNRVHEPGSYIFSNGGSIIVDPNLLPRVSKYSWHPDKEERVLCNMTTRQRLNWPYNQNLKPRARRIKVDLRRYLWDLTDYTLVDLRNNILFLNGDHGDYRLKNIPVVTILNNQNTIFPDVFVLLDKELRGSYGAIAFLPDYTEKIFPLPEFNKKGIHMTTQQRGYLESAAIVKAWEAAHYYDEYTFKLKGPTYPRYNFLSTIGL